MGEEVLKAVHEKDKGSSRWLHGEGIYIQFELEIDQETNILEGMRKAAQPERIKTLENWN